ncbi:glycosyltransferase family 4 protein [Clostridium perfringens]|nr:glycosyltransferase family 4 protein [Clostridium perfringens]MDM0769766.1 glycosyltransferase family 4 protein [Clostridium perfringens]
MKKTKIIQVCAIDSTMDVLLRRLNSEILKAGYDLKCICSEGDKTEKLSNEGFEMISVNIDRAIKPIGNIKTIVQLYKVFKEEKPDIVHVHTPIAAVLGRIASKLARVPNIVYTAHGFYFHENMSLLTFKICFFIEKYIGRYFTDFIFTQSSEDCLLAQKNKFLKKNRIMAIGNGVDLWNKFNNKVLDREELLKIKSNLGIEKEDIVVTFVGRLVREKGILELLEGFNSIKDENIKLLLIGDTFQGDRDLECKESIEKFKENKNIKFMGKRDDINKLLSISDIFCLPSYREGMPRSIIEAMAMENAIIATNIRGSREEVLDGETGFLINLNNPKEIEEKIKYLKENKVLLESMKKNGRKRAEELYDEGKVVMKQLDVFKKLLNN